MNTPWSGKMLPSSPKMSLNRHRLSSRKHGGPAIGNTQLALRSSMYRQVRSNCRSRFCLPNAVLADSGSSYTIGYQMAPENCRMCACTWPSSANTDRSVGRASFWLSSRTPSYSTHSDESPIGPSVGEVSA
jgi:hypothetical protein